MESHFDGSSPQAAVEMLDALQTDRDRLVENVKVPWPLLAAFGGAGVWWVAAAASARPGADYEPPASSWLALVAALVIAYLVRRETGIRFRAMGARAAWAVTGIIATCLILFSVSLGLASFGLHWAVVLTSLGAFVVTTLLSGVAYRSALAKIRRG